MIRNCSSKPANVKQLFIIESCVHTTCNQSNKNGCYRVTWCHANDTIPNSGSQMMQLHSLDGMQESIVETSCGTSCMYLQKITLDNCSKLEFDLIGQEPTTKVWRPVRRSSDTTLVEFGSGTRADFCFSRYQSSSSYHPCESKAKNWVGCWLWYPNFPLKSAVFKVGDCLCRVIMAPVIAESEPTSSPQISLGQIIP